MSNEFSGDDYEFAVGSLSGLRSWAIDDQGRLRGVSHAAIWKPGENVSSCAGGNSYCPQAFALYTTGKRRCEHPRCDGLFHRREKGHRFDPECGCGFWAYNDLRFVRHGVVQGVIEGYGKTTIGTKGFRCERARIVALTRDNDTTEGLQLSLWLRLKQLYPGARFYDDVTDGFGEMVAAHGATMKTWSTGPEDEGFWADKPEPDREAIATAVAGSYATLAAGLASTALSASITSPFLTLPPPPARTAPLPHPRQPSRWSRWRKS